MCSEPVLQDMVYNFFGAGSETVRLSVEWLVLTSAGHQDAQDRIHQEIDNVIGRNRLPIWSDHTSMPFTEAFIMEQMRWRTVIPINLMRYIRMGSQYVVVLNDFQSTKDAFAEDAFIGRPPVSILDHNKETIDTEAFNGLPWKEQRRFSLHMLKELGLGKSKMEEQMREEIANLLNELEKNVDKPYYVYEVLASSMSNNIGSLVFGKRFKYDDPTRHMLNKFVKDTASGISQVAWLLFFPWIKTIFQFLGAGDVNSVTRMGKTFRDYIMKEINEHERTLNPNNVRDYIDGYLLEIEKRKDDPAFCKAVLQDMVYNFFGAGSETVRTTVEWLVLTSAGHQDAQDRIHQEIDDVIGRNRLPIWSDHTSMPFTEAFIMEQMRWRTVIPMNLMRYALLDGELNGYHIPKGSHLLANYWAIDHNPEYWGDDAEEFKPERFLTEDGREVKKWEHFIPFSIGKRACPGESLAKTEVFLYFTSILQRFHLRLPDGKVPDFEGELGITLQPIPQELIFRKRN